MIISEEIEIQKRTFQHLNPSYNATTFYTSRTCSLKINIQILLCIIQQWLKNSRISDLQRSFGRFGSRSNSNQKIS